MMQLYDDVISERYKHKIQFLPIPVENEHFTQKNMSNSKRMRISSIITKMFNLPAKRT